MPFDYAFCDHEAQIEFSPREFKPERYSRSFWPDLSNGELKIAKSSWHINGLTERQEQLSGERCPMTKKPYKEIGSLSIHSVFEEDSGVLKVSLNEAGYVEVSISETHEHGMTAEIDLTFEE
ncbi:Imm64 family immunity protein [Paenibacillus sp. GbtcB18]|uniref:Imm64 family immunity protein n=1 Tax=Paenibacillus sp. GbtcB18 TaxID=2824763 RepID=UPI0020C6C31C|nr:Imm64 family immunity protein [Paenibacillus sp. GbtcB18]